MDDFANAFDPVIAGWEEQDEGNVQDDVGGNASDCSCDDDNGCLAAGVGGNVGEGGGGGENGHDGAGNGASGIDRSVQDIMRNLVNLVVPKSADSYALNNANFIVWLFNSHSELFVDDIFVAYLNSFETSPKKKRRIKTFLLQMNHGNVCPFDLSCINFKIFSEFLV